MFYIKSKKEEKVQSVADLSTAELRTTKYRISTIISKLLNWESEFKAKWQDLLPKSLDNISKQILLSVFMDSDEYNLARQNVINDFGQSDSYFSKEEIIEILKSIFSGKKVLELGCRQGKTLAFISSLGAEIKGTTSDKYLKLSKSYLEAENLVIGNLNKLDKNQIKELQDFDADILISSNLFDTDRLFPRSRVVHSERLKLSNPDNIDQASQKKIQIFKTEMLGIIKQLVTSETIIYLVPSLDTFSMIVDDDFQIVDYDLLGTSLRLSGQGIRNFSLINSAKGQTDNLDRFIGLERETINKGMCYRFCFLN